MGGACRSIDITRCVQSCTRRSKHVHPDQLPQTASTVALHASPPPNDSAAAVPCGGGHEKCGDEEKRRKACTNTHSMLLLIHCTQ